MGTIKLCQQFSPARLSWRWRGDTIEDRDLLRRIPGTLQSFSDSEYEAVLDAISAFGFALETPITVTESTAAAFI
jgi:hypothetical protein